MENRIKDVLNEQTFVTPGAMQPAAPKYLSVHSTLNTDGSCDVKIQANNLTVEQELKLALLISSGLAQLAADQLTVNCTANVSALANTPVLLLGGMPKTLWARIVLNADGPTKVQANIGNLTAEQLGKLTLWVQYRLSVMVFDKLGMIRGDTDVSLLK